MEHVLWTMKHAIVCVYEVATVIFVICMAKWQMLIIIPFMLAYLIYIFKFTIGSYREMGRLNGVMRSPILTHLGEAIAGNSTIRAFNKSLKFHERNYKDINNLILCHQVSLGTYTWYSTQMNMISVVVLAFSTISCIILKDKINPVVLAMVFQYVLKLHGCMIGLFHCSGNLEGMMVGIQRCF
jgi:ATP-binding cassette subfamily C (CFTR/MRP) protein 1